MRRRLLSASLLTVLLAVPAVAQSGLENVSAVAQQPHLIVVGFAGGFIKRTSTINGEVALASRLREEYGPAMQVAIFENHHGEEAHHAILAMLGAVDGKLSDAARKAARIVLYGHSWGASEADAVARRLKKDGIPVLLLIEVDGVPKRGEDDGIVPANVAQAINFYQHDGMLHGRSAIRAADPAATEILGNIRLSYKKDPVSTPGYPWYTKVFTRYHIEIENDPQVWRRVEQMIVAELTPGTKLEAATLTPPTQPPHTPQPTEP